MMSRVKLKLFEGGNLALKGKEAEQINLKVTDRSYIVPILNNLLYSINQAFAKQYKVAIWSPELLQKQSFLSGSSLHFFNVKGIPDDVFVAKKPKVGDIDTMVNKDLEAYLSEFLTGMEDKQIGPATLVGFQRGNEQFSSLWELQEPPIKVQIDFEFVEFDQDEPTEWAKFSHSSSWEDLSAGVKGVFHKFLIQSLAALTKQEFLLRKMVGRGKAKEEQDIPTVDNMVSFAVSSKEGGGLRAKYTPVIDPNTNKPLVKDGMYVMTAAPAAGYEQKVGNIFAKLFGKRLSPKAAQAVATKFWSFTGLLEVMSNLLKPEEKQNVINSFLEKTLGAGAQGLYKNDPNRDLEEKSIAINKMFEVLGMKPSSNLQQLKQDYKNAYKMTATESIIEADGDTPKKPDYRRVGIQHISNPGSSTEMRDSEFIELCREIAANNGKLDGMPINLKVDGAGIRFGKDQSGKPFFLTSRITTPMYAENVGDFTKYGVSKGQTPEQLERTKQYDYALDAIVNSDFINVLPPDTIVQAEMLFNGMAQQTPEGLKFVNISYDPKKLGQVMTLVPFSVKTFSTGQTSPEETEIKKELVAQSNSKVKIVNNQLEQQGVDVSKIIAPVLSMGPDLLATLQSRTKDTPEKEQAKAILAKARLDLSDFIIQNPKLKGKDQLGSNIEGLVLNMPSGRLAKITSSLMKEKMAAKRVAPAGPKSGKTAVVTAGSFVGHKGHEQLVNYVIEKAAQLKADPYVYISSSVGPDDPIPPEVKLQTWQKLYPQYKNMFQVIQPGGSVAKKIEKELVTATNPPPYDSIIMMVGEDRYEGFKNWMEHLSKRMKNPQYPGFEHVTFDVINTPRSAESGGTGISFTQLRNILKDPNATEEQQLDLWCQGFDEKKLGRDYIKYLMDIAKKNMGIAPNVVKESVKNKKAKLKLKEFIQRVRPMLKEASVGKKLEVLKFIKESMQSVAEDSQSNDSRFQQINSAFGKMQQRKEFYGKTPNDLKGAPEEIGDTWDDYKRHITTFGQRPAVRKLLDPATDNPNAVPLDPEKLKKPNFSSGQDDPWDTEPNIGTVGSLNSQKTNQATNSQTQSNIDQDVAESEEPFNLEKRHPMDYGMRNMMIRRIAKATGYETSGLNLCSDKELTQMYHEHIHAKKKEVDETIEKVGSQYRLVSKHGHKNLGTYPTKAGAKKRERQVQYFKHANEDYLDE